MLGYSLPAFPAPGKGVVWDEAAMAKLQPQHHAGWVVLCVLDWSAGDPVVHLGQRPARAQPAAGGWQLSLAVLDQHPGELAVRIPPATDVRGPDDVPDPPQQPRVQRQRRPDATVAGPDREAAQSPGGRGRQGQGGQQQLTWRYCHGDHDHRDPDRARDDAGGGGRAGRAGVAGPPARRPQLTSGPRPHLGGAGTGDPDASRALSLAVSRSTSYGP